MAKKMIWMIDDVGTTMTTDVTIAVNNNAAIAFVEGDKGNHLQ